MSHRPASPEPQLVPLVRAAHAVEPEAAEAARLIRQAQPLGGLSAEARTRLGHRLRAARRLGSRRPALRWVAVAALFVAGVAGAAGIGFTVGTRRSPHTPALSAPSRPPRARPPVGEPPPPAPEALVPERPAPTTAAPAPRGRAQVAPALREQRLVADAQRALRQDQDPASALRLLDVHAARFPDGALRPEARLGRLEALLALGRTADALALLETLSLATLPRPFEWRVTRGELRAAHGRCAEAQADFDAALAAPPSASSFAGASSELLARARYGRGVCRARRGDMPGARADFQAVAENHPTSPLARKAVRALYQP